MYMQKKKKKKLRVKSEDGHGRAQKCGIVSVNVFSGKLYLVFTQMNAISFLPEK